ncbi:sulfite exporter TauE/SafE family protein [Desulfonema magnum]|uniref:Probable membrane transporter protein n=1 Tax=Desulfonema magnum TaxID=45655 RepID=A0A975BEU9_9BACT|nr:sulfite exporter TauE/SafE family protein [Desulfonema magnum]QTA84232.1 Transmembrane domain-containing protein, TauE-like [Desulfonema magnum]
MTNKKRFPYIILAIAAGLWIILFPYFYKDFFNEFFYMPFLGIIAATVANTTPAAAGIVYFPILTRLHVLPATAVQFNMMIQAYGMGLGTFKWFLVNKKLFICEVIPICLVGGIIGVVVSIIFFPIGNPELLTLVFNFIAFMLTQIIFFSILWKHKYPRLHIDLNTINILILISFSFLGGLISGWIGFGIDTIFYFVLTVIFKINPAAAIVTSISLMAAVSVAGTLINAFFYEVPLSLWYSAIPGVTIAGLFLAAYLAVKLGAKNVLILFTFLLSIDFFVTLWTQHSIPINQTLRLLITYVLIVYLIFIHIKIFKKSYKDIDTSLGEFRPRE